MTPHFKALLITLGSAFIGFSGIVILIKLGDLHPYLPGAAVITPVLLFVYFHNLKKFKG